jgi:hypothetical protein
MVHRRPAAAPWEVLRAAAVCVPLGIPLGVAWWWLAPIPLVVVRGDGVFLTNPETSAFIAADGWFAALGLLAGLLSAGLVYGVARGRGVPALLGLTIGGLLASLVAWQLGHLLGPDELLPRAEAAAEGATLEAPLDLRAWGVLLLWPVAAISGFVALTLRLEPSDESPGPVPEQVGS